MKNGSLSDVLLQVKRGETPNYWTHTNIVKAIVGVIMGMKYLHSKNFIHRDLKPSNILVDDEGRIRIGDFGCARMEDCGCQTASTLGARPYVAPEVLSGMTPTKKVDVFAFGLTLYEILLGESVFPKNIKPVQMVRPHDRGSRTDIPEGTHPAVRNVIQQCWSEKAEDRPTFDEIYKVLSENWFPFFTDQDNGAIERFAADVKSQEQS
jgi:serine/threonine protein kinase